MTFESIVVVGDLHLRTDPPRSRIDNYFDTCMHKIDMLMERHKYVIILGDFFDKSGMPVEGLNETIDRLSRYSGRLYSILGNHDAHYRTLNLNKTSLGLLNKIGIVQLKLDTFSIEGLSFDVASVVPKLELPEKKSEILLGHFFLENTRTPQESLDRKELLDYKYVVLGHEHCPHEPIQAGDTTIFRNGSLTRKDADEDNLQRNSIVYLEFSYNGDVSLRDLKIADPNLVFTPESFSKPKSKIICDFSNLELLMQNIQEGKSKSNMSTREVLITMKASESCICYLAKIHEELGFYY